jgi:phage-related protein
MLPISSQAIIEKNKITSDGVWLLLLEILYENEEPVCVCLNNETINWDNKTWLPAIFNLSGIVETKDAEIPSIPLTIFDLNRTLIPILEKYNGGIGAQVIIRVVHSKYLSNTIPEFEEITEIIDATIDDSAKITFKLGAENLIDRRCPQQRYLKNNCRFIFKQAELTFTSGGVTEITNSHYIKGDVSGHTAKIVDIKLKSGAFSNGDASGILTIFTINGGFQAETISIYNDNTFTNLVQSNVATLDGSSTGKCGYVGSETDCNRSFTRCKELGNERRFGGFIGVSATGYLK